jgi:uncharacterized protein YoxC
MTDFLIFMTFWIVICIMITVSGIERIVKDMKKEWDHLRKDVDSIMVQTWKLEDGK